MANPRATALTEVLRCFRCSAGVHASPTRRVSSSSARVPKKSATAASTDESAVRISARVRGLSGCTAGEGQGWWGFAGGWRRRGGGVPPTPGPSPAGGEGCTPRGVGDGAGPAQAIVTRRAETRRQFGGAPFAQARLYRAYANRARWPRSGHAPKPVRSTAVPPPPAYHPPLPTSSVAWYSRSSSPRQTACSSESPSNAS
jgi:hypothetical protein